MCIRIQLLLALSLLVLPGLAQVDKAFEAEKRALEKELTEFQGENQKEFDQYVDEIDKEFSTYLREAWKEFNLFAGMKPDTAPKPKVLPKFDPIKPKTEPPRPKEEGIEKIKPGGISREIEIKPGNGSNAPVMVPLPNIPVVMRSEQEDAPSKPSFLDFYGTPVDLTYDPNLAGTLPDEIHNTTIAAFWDRVNKTNYVGLIKQLNDLKTKMNLNDWGYYQLVRKTAEKIGGTQNYSRLLTWFLLTKSGYRTRVSYAENNICLMFPSTNNIYGIRYFMIDNIKFYAPDFNHNQIFTFEKDFPGASKVFDLNIYDPLQIGDATDARTIKFNFKGKDYSFPIHYNLNSINFYKEFPLSEITVEFDASVSDVARTSLIKALQPQIQGLSAADGVDFLLSFVQNGFAYKTDQDQFNGEEKFFFPEEDFYYPYSDCDDRAVLFAYLVQELLGLEVIGIAYPGHIATAVKFPEEEAGDYVVYKGEKYTIADPTYIGAPFGLTMPGMDNKKAEIIELANQPALEKVWEKALTGGVKRDNKQQDLTTDKAGNIFISGFFSGNAAIGGTTLSTTAGRTDAFLAKFNPHGNPEWAIQGNAEGDARANGIATDAQGNIYICGKFATSISFGKIMMMAKEENPLFVAKFNPDGKLIWLNQPEPVAADGNESSIFVASFTPDGRNLTTKTYPPDRNFNSFGLSFDASGNVYLTAEQYDHNGNSD